MRTNALDFNALNNPAPVVETPDRITFPCGISLQSLEAGLRKLADEVAGGTLIPQSVDFHQKAAHDNFTYMTITIVVGEGRKA